MNPAFRAVFWDFGGVITSSPFEAFRRFEAERGLPRDFLRDTNAVNPEHNAWARLELNDVALDAFDALFLAETTARGHPVRGRDVLPLLATRVRPYMVEVLGKVKAAGYRVACLTNNAATGLGPGMSLDADTAGEIAAAMALFEFVLESSKAGVRKPEPRFYAIACERMGVAPEQVVYLDDLGINLKPARTMGMHTIKVADPRVAIAELAAVLDLPL